MTRIVSFRRWVEILTRLWRRSRAFMTREMERWESKQGVDFLRRIGLKKGDTVLDFGARVGHYTLPAAVVTGTEGKVLAVDKDREALVELKDKAESRGLEHIVPVHTRGGVNLSLPDAFADFVFLYDVLHFMPPQDRCALYTECRRLLKPEGVLSVYPKHLSDDWPNHHFETLCVQDVTDEVVSAGFVLRESLQDTVSHDDSLVEGRILNFLCTR